MRERGIMRGVQDRGLRKRIRYMRRRRLRIGIYEVDMGGGRIGEGRRGNGRGKKKKGWSWE